uniref:Uncharacterized protein n=1 Tax=Siphoviridae sp. ctDyb2 TaxID=2826201 RepID=A0A8S5MCF3_9CAUD|nr:MAG TPA: hypothetical protein [Siphoviridae sp. ctDyb2]
MVWLRVRHLPQDCPQQPRYRRLQLRPHDGG